MQTNSPNSCAVLSSSFSSCAVRAAASRAASSRLMRSSRSRVACAFHNEQKQSPTEAFVSFLKAGTYVCGLLGVGIFERSGGGVERRARFGEPLCKLGRHLLLRRYTEHRTASVTTTKKKYSKSQVPTERSSSLARSVAAASAVSASATRFRSASSFVCE